MDAHVHLYEQFVLSAFFESAAANFARAARQLALPAETPGCLLLAESTPAHPFERLRRESRVAGEAGWSVQPTQEPAALVVARGGQPRIAVIAGRQVVTREGLEVLSLGSAERVAPGEPMETTLAAIRAAGALAVLPWGFGKWWFRRGRIVRALLRSGRQPDLLLGDNGGRPRAAPAPAAFREAAARGQRVLPGSDPLPLPGQVRRVGSYGLVLPLAPDWQRPAAQVVQALRSLEAQPASFGQRQGWASFVRSQVGLRRRRGPEPLPAPADAPSAGHP